MTSHFAISLTVFDPVALLLSNKSASPDSSPRILLLAPLSADALRLSVVLTEPAQAILVDSSSAAVMSTNHSTTGEIAIAEDSLRIWSCVTCRRRKVKCDRKDPCSNCVKNQIECHFPVTGRLPRRRDPAAWKSPTEKQAELLDRLRRLESLVTELAAQVEDGPDKIQSLFTGPLTSATGVIHSGETVNAAVGKQGLLDAKSPMAVGELISAMKSSFQEEMNEDFGRLVVGKEAGLQIGKGFWSIFCNEVWLNFQQFTTNKRLMVID